MAYGTLKKAIVTLLVLGLPDFNLPFEIEIHASEFGSGVVLSQNKKPIANFSHKLLVAAREKSLYERELMASVLLVEK